MLMELAHRKTHDDYGTLKEAAAAYIEAQFELVFAVRAAYDDGVAVTELNSSWLSVAARQAVIETRIETAQEEAQGGKSATRPARVLDPLRTADYEPCQTGRFVRPAGTGGARTGRARCCRSG